MKYQFVVCNMVAYKKKSRGDVPQNSSLQHLYRTTPDEVLTEQIILRYYIRNNFLICCNSQNPKLFKRRWPWGLMF